MDDDALRTPSADPIGFGCVRPNLAPPRARAWPERCHGPWLSLGQALAQGEAEKESDTTETSSENRLPFAAHPFPHPNMGYGFTAAVVRFIWQRLGARVPRMR